jgi:glyoxylase-like metal-dependent hydrolase (beta-lactamase superfamily II)
MIREVAPNVYERRVHPEGVAWFLNTFLILTDQANIYIDSGLGSYALEDFDKIADPIKPNILIYTHYHFDHVWGSGALEFSKVIACEPFNTLLQDDFDLSYAYFKELKEGKVTCVYADTLIEYKTQIGPLTLYPAPGHTRDGLIIHDTRNNLVIVGDNLPDQGKGLLPEIEDSAAYMKTLLLIQSLQPKTLLGSHCDEVSAKQVEAMMKSLTSTVKV